MNEGMGMGQCTQSEPRLETMGATIVATRKEQRKRKVELTTIANECLELAESRGVKSNEHCSFGEICQLLWRY